MSSFEVMQRSTASRQIAGRIALMVGIFLARPFWCLAFDPGTTTEFSLSQEIQYCLNCHDGAPAALIHRRHPVGIDYLFAQVRSNGKLKPPRALDPNVYLKDNRLTCMSCHHPESRQPAKVLLGHAGSRLCLTCHNL